MRTLRDRLNNEAGKLGITPDALRDLCMRAGLDTLEAGGELTVREVRDNPADRFEKRLAADSGTGARVVSLRIPRSLKAKLDAAAAREGRTRSGFVQHHLAAILGVEDCMPEKPAADHRSRELGRSELRELSGYLGVPQTKLRKLSSRIGHGTTRRLFGPEDGES